MVITLDFHLSSPRLCFFLRIPSLFPLAPNRIIQFGPPLSQIRPPLPLGNFAALVAALYLGACSSRAPRRPRRARRRIFWPRRINLVNLRMGFPRSLQRKRTANPIQMPMRFYRGKNGLDWEEQTLIGARQPERDFLCQHLWFRLVCEHKKRTNVRKANLWTRPCVEHFAWVKFQLWNKILSHRRLDSYDLPDPMLGCGYFFIISSIGQWQIVNIVFSLHCYYC